MKLRDIMTSPVVRIHPEENVAVAARLLEHNNIGAMPVCTHDGKLVGMVTDRDIVTRCLAADKDPRQTRVREVMTGRVYVGRPDMDVPLAAGLMGKEQIRRLPVMENGILCGMVSIGDMARKEEISMEAADALGDISSGLYRGE